MNLKTIQIAQKYLNEDFEVGLQDVKWQAFHPKYLICLYVLRDNFEEASKLMKSNEVTKEIGKEGFRTWPVFREFRKTELFKLTYKEIFDEEYILNPKEDLIDKPIEEEIVEIVKE